MQRRSFFEGNDRWHVGKLPYLRKPCARRGNKAAVKMECPVLIGSGGGRSLMRTRLSDKFPVKQGIYRE